MKSRANFSSKKRISRNKQTVGAYGLLKKYCIAYIHLVNYLKNSIKDDYVYVQLGYHGGIGHHINALIGIAWICKKLSINLKIINPDSCLLNIFENSTLYYSQSCKHDNSLPSKEPITHLEILKRNRVLFVNTVSGYGCKLPNKFGHEVISKLCVKPHIQQQADNWYHKNIKGKCIGVHYRGSDSPVITSGIEIPMETYIAYLKEVLDQNICIFVCSDQAQFIECMKSTFPGRVISRNIKRSYVDEPIHFDKDYKQTIDACIDLLILTKIRRFFTSGSNFTSITRFINPSVEIISIVHRNRRTPKNVPNYIPVPKKDFFDQYNC